MNPHEQRLRSLTRRQFFRDCGAGLGSLALASLLNQKLFAGPVNDLNPLAPRAPHFPARIKRVIYLFMAGAPSQLDLFDHKPKLNELHNQPVPESLIKGERFAFIKGIPKLLGSPHTFKKYGQSAVSRFRMHCRI